MKAFVNILLWNKHKQEVQFSSLIAPGTECTSDEAVVEFFNIKDYFTLYVESVQKKQKEFLIYTTCDRSCRRVVQGTPEFETIRTTLCELRNKDGLMRNTRFKISAREAENFCTKWQKVKKLNYDECVSSFLYSISESNIDALPDSPTPQ